MARNEVYRDADKVSLPVPQDTPAGTPVIVGSLPGITQTAEGGGGNVDGQATVWRQGAWRVPVTGAVTVGQPVYIPTTGGALTATVGTNVVWGYALAAKGAGTGDVVVAIAKV